MTQILEGSLDGQRLSIAVVVARFNEPLTTRLLNGTQLALHEHGVTRNRITITWVPGSFEIPLIAKMLALSHKFDSIICLGAIIKKETAHFEYVSEQTARGISTNSSDTGVPIIFGVLTTYTMAQGIERSDETRENRGYLAGVAAIQMGNLVRRIKEEP